MKDSKHSTARRNFRRGILVLAILAAIIAALPHIVANTPLRDVVLNRVAAPSGFRVTTQSASFGWFSPVRLRGVAAEREDAGIALQIEGVELEREWLPTWMGLPRLGRVVIDRPELDVVVPREATPKPRKRPSRPVSATFVVRDASFRLLSPDDHHAIVALSGIDLGLRIEGEAAARVLDLDPMTVLERATLTPEVCDRGLQLIAPILANTTQVSGKASLAIERCRIPLGVDDPKLILQQTDLRGKAELHEVTTSLKHSLLGDSVELVARLLRVDLPEQLRIADDTEVAFEVRDGRVYHEGLVFLIPEISPDMMWQTHGSVGLDETLDLTIQVQIPFSLAGESRFSRQLTDQPISFRIVGTLDDPKVRFPEDHGWLRAASGIVMNEVLPEDTQPLTGKVLDLLQQIRDRRSETPAENPDSPQPRTSVLDKIRERLNKRRDSGADDEGNGQG